jgi:hypothetical protein
MVNRLSLFSLISIVFISSTDIENKIYKSIKVKDMIITINYLLYLLIIDIISFD